MSKDFDTRAEADIALNFPIEVDGVEYKKLTMRRPKTKDSMKVAKFKGSEAEKGTLLLAILCGVSPDVIEELDEVDADALGDQYKAFTGRQSEK